MCTQELARTARGNGCMTRLIERSEYDRAEVDLTSESEYFPGNAHEGARIAKPADECAVTGGVIDDHPLAAHRRLQFAVMARYSAIVDLDIAIGVTAENERAPLALQIDDTDADAIDQDMQAGDGGGRALAVACLRGWFYPWLTPCLVEATRESSACLVTRVVPARSVVPVVEDLRCAWLEH